MTSPSVAVAARPGLLARIRRSPLARNRAALVGLAIFIPLLAMTFLPSLLAGDPNAQELSRSLRAPGDGLLLGADKLGRDVWARSPSPIRLTEMTASMIAPPDASAVHGLWRRYIRASASIEPQSGSGGCWPRPRKLSAAMSRIA